MNLWDDLLRPLWDGLNRPEAAGVGGALLSLQWGPGATKMAQFAFVGSGAALTIWLLPAIVEFYGVRSDRYVIALAFFCGAGGPFVLAKFVDALVKMPWKELARLLTGSRR